MDRWEEAMRGAHLPPESYEPVLAQKDALGEMHKDEPQAAFDPASYFQEPQAWEDTPVAPKPRAPKAVDPTPKKETAAPVIKRVDETAGKATPPKMPSYTKAPAAPDRKVPYSNPGVQPQGYQPANPYVSWAPYGAYPQYPGHAYGTYAAYPAYPQPNAAWQNVPRQNRYEQNPYGQNPYVPNIPRQTPPAAQKQPVKPEKKAGKIWAAIGVAVLLVGIGCGITAAVVRGMYVQENRDLHLQLESQTQEFEDRIDYVEDLLEDQTLRYESRIEDLEEKVEDLERQGQTQQTPNSPSSGALEVLPEGSMTPAQLYKHCVSSVVAITNEAVNDYGKYATAGTGSGFILTEDGYIVTNHHVIENADRLRVTLSNGLNLDAKLVGSDSINDVAVLKVDVDQDLPAAILGSSDGMRIGDQVVAIGNPLGDLTATATVGYISGKDRPVNTDGTIIDMLQTDAAINPGNSGGPLFNMYGEVIGITTAKYSGITSSGASIEGIGFAIPMDDVLGLIQDLKEHGRVTGGYLGVEVSSVNPAYAKQNDIPLGAVVKKVTEGSCAEKAGVLAEDIITKLGEHTIENLSDLTRALREMEAGERVELQVYRSGKTLKLKVTLDEKP